MERMCRATSGILDLSSRAMSTASLLYNLQNGYVIAYVWNTILVTGFRTCRGHRPQWVVSALLHWVHSTSSEPVVPCLGRPIEESMEGVNEDKVAESGISTFSAFFLSLTISSLLGIVPPSQPILAAFFLVLDKWRQYLTSPQTTPSCQLATPHFVNKTSCIRG